MALRERKPVQGGNNHWHSWIRLALAGAPRDQQYFPGVSPHLHRSHPDNPLPRDRVSSCLLTSMLKACYVG